MPFDQLLYNVKTIADKLTDDPTLDLGDVQASDYILVYRPSDGRPSGFANGVDAGKLANIEAEATKNQTDAHLLSRANHTGTQSKSTIDGLELTLNNLTDSVDSLTINSASFVISNKSYNGVQQTDFGSAATWLPIAPAHLIPTGNEILDGGSFVSGLNLLDTMYSLNETTYDDLIDYTGFQFKDTANLPLNGTGRWFNDINKNWLAPSPLNTFNVGENKRLSFKISIPELMITVQNSFNGNAIYLYIRILRYNFNAQNRKIISYIPITLPELVATTNVPYSIPLCYSLSIKGEINEFVSTGDGFYIDIIKSSNSTAGVGNPVYLRHVKVDIERN